jgi:large subunit ribosomal protein L11
MVFTIYIVENIEMAAKKISKQFVVYAVAWNASPKPPLGPTMGQNGVPIGVFMKEFNDRTRDLQAKWGDVKVPAIVRVYIDKSYDFELLPPITSHLILSKAKVAKWSLTPNKVKSGKITMKDLLEIAEIKKPVMNTEDIDSIVKSLIGTAKTLGIEVIQG